MADPLFPTGSHHEKLARDAGRYRWAREQSPDVLLDLYMDIPGNASPEEWDEAIDRAMARSSTGGANGKA